MINLSTVRGAKTSAGDNCVTPADLVCRPVHTQEMRFHSNYGAAWWMIELPRPFKLSDHRIGYRDPMQSVGYRIKVSAEPLDEIDWARRKPVFEFRGPVRELGRDGLCRGWTTGEFETIQARFVRIEWFGHNGSEQGQPGREHPDLIVGKIQLYGPNRVEINPSISVAQSAWAGGSVVLADAGGGSSSAAAVIDDSDPKARGFGYLNQSFQTNPGDADLAKLAAKPAAFTVTLKHTGMVEAVGYSSVAPPRDERPRDMAIYTSPHAIGERWMLQKQLRDIAGGAYEEIAFDAPVKAKRVKFVVERVWNNRVDPSRHTAGGYMAELYVYATALPGNVRVTLEKDAVTSASVFDSSGRPVRTLWQLRPMTAGTHVEEWDGMTDTFEEAPPGKYELRLISNAGRYENVAALGNTGDPPDADGHVPMSLSSVAVDDEGAVYSANGWDEAGHDWKKWDRDGRSVLHSDYQVRNGDPNGLPYCIAVDDRFLYVVYISHHGYGKIGSQWIQRFDRRTGKPERFPKGLQRNGLIQVYPCPEQDDWDQPITDIVITERLLLLGDRRANQVLKYDKTTGERLSHFPVENPGTMAIDATGRLWVVQDKNRVAVFNLEGRRLAEPLTDLGEIVGMCFGPDNTLYLADGDSRQLLIYRINDLKATREREFGRKAQPGDDAPDRFHQLIDVAVGTDGGVVTVERLPVGGTRLMRWPADLKKPLWTHLGLEFTGNAAYSTDDPDTIVSSYFQRYRVDKQAGEWTFRGNLFTGGYIGNGWWHGPPRWVKLDDNRFFYFANGDGIQAYRLVGDQLRFVMATGGREPDVHGKFPQGAPLGQWTWTDADGDAAVDDEEVMWHKQPGEGRYAVFGMNVDARGNVIYCDHHTKSIWLIPLAGLNEAGNPRYDWAQAKELVPADQSDVKFFPLMAVRNERNEVYAFGRSELFPQHPGSGPAWMGGWALAKFDADGNRLWATRLAQHCTGMDYVPGDGGVVVGYFAKAIVYHYNRDGILVGSAGPGAPAAGISGWLDNTASIACNRDPRDGKIDVFAEEDYAHRILWYRFDDSHIRITRQTIEKK